MAFRNEKERLSKVVEHLINQDFSSDDMEIIIVDGESTDGSLDSAQSYQNKHSHIKLITNKNKENVFGNNIGIQQSNSEFIFFIDIHGDYPNHYVSGMIQHLEEQNADKIAGKWVVKSSKTSLISESIAAALNSQFVVGNVPFRMEASEVKETIILPSGCYPKETFTRYGDFDETLRENYEIEMSGRILQNGGKALLIPQMEIPYYGPATLNDTIGYFYRTAYYKPLENERLKASASTRQMAPALILIFFAFTAITSVMSPLMLFLFIFGAMVYLFGDIWESFGIGIMKDKARLTTLLLFIFPIMHLSYGLGYLHGLWNRRMKERKKSIE